MSLAMKRLPLFLTLATAASAAVACPQLAEPEQMAAARIAEADARSLVERHLADADEVFVGRLLELERGQHPTVDDDGNEGRLSAFKVRLDPIHIIKGAPVPETIYTFERNDDVLHLGCSPLVGEDHISFDDGPGYRFIVYARRGTVL